MKRVAFVTTALICACLLAAGTASAQLFQKKAKSVPQTQSQTVWTQQSPHPPNPTVRTPVAGYSPNFAAPQPATKATLTADANRLIRWQGWLDVDAFSISVLNQMQKQLGNAIEVGSFTIDGEPAIAEAVVKAKLADPTFEVNPNLYEGANFEGTPKLYVWTYRHNFTDTGLYQLYVSAKGKMDIGEGWKTPPPYVIPVRHEDIQSLAYEFGADDSDGVQPPPKRVPVIVDVEIWRGAVARVNARGELEVVGNEAGVVTIDGSVVERLPLSDWERAPSLICNPNYDPRLATGAAFVEPLERALTIRENTVQKQAGDVQSRVRTITPFRYRTR